MSFDHRIEFWMSEIQIVLLKMHASHPRDQLILVIKF
jgi:hypothetical protein